MTNKNQNKNNKKGAALLLFVIFFLLTSFTLTLSIGRGVYDDLAAYRILESGKKSMYGAESGIEDAIYRHRKGKNYSSTESFTIDTVLVHTTRTTVGDTYEIVSEGNNAEAIRKGKLALAIGDGASFNFGMQSGNGGIAMSNSSSVQGNVFSNGTISGSGNMIYGDAIAAGPSGLLSGVHATGSAWAHTINNSTIDKDAYYVSNSATIVGGTSFPGSADQATATMPIPDSLIQEWKDNIVNTGTVISSTSTQCAGGEYKINSDTVLNNVKINCNVDMNGNGTDITIAGPVWITGNLQFSNGPTIIASSSLGTKSVPIIVDKESDRTTSSKVDVKNSTNFNSGNALSYVTIITMNNSAELGGGEYAVEMVNSALGKVLFYAPHGLINLKNNVSLKEVTAYKIATYNSAQVIYESGLANLLFTSGPGGGYSVNSWNETQ